RRQDANRMAHIYLCFLWHMHQPFYKDLLSGEYRLPWTRMHALKDYYGMVHILEEFPEVHQTFNLVPSLMVQVEEYARGEAVDPFLKCALKPAEELTEHEQDFILRYFFQASVTRLINRYPRYAELYEAWQVAGRNPVRARRFFGTSAMRDLQVLSQLAWFDEEFLAHDAEVSALVKKEREYTVDDQLLLGRKQTEMIGLVLPAYAEALRRSQIEVSTTPFYHPILPLICDSNIAQVSHPHVPLPTRFRYPGDARWQLDHARSYMESRLGSAPVGLWPSEGSVSDEALEIAADAGFRWFATDNGVLGRTLGSVAGVEQTYKSYRWKREGRELLCLFRDHYLSDLIGFVYQRMEANDAAGHFLGLIRDNCRGMLASGRDALVPIILDGENAWEHYPENGRPFLQELYRRISEDPDMRAVTVSEAFERIEAETIHNIFPGSWINANFDIWIGAEEDNKAWEYLLRARQAYDRVVSSEPGLSIEAKRVAHEELMIAEGSDWCWWYGPQHESANRPEFDRLFRDHLANVYRALNVSPPEELSRPILQVSIREFHELPTAPVRPSIDGEVTSYFEWLGAGLYKVDGRSGAMHGQRYLIRELRYGSDGYSIYLRVDFEEGFDPADMEARFTIAQAAGSGASASIVLNLSANGVEPVGSSLQGEYAYHSVLEMKLPLPALGISIGNPVRVQMSMWHGGLPVDALPPQGWLEVSTAEPSDWPL
ncbi:MAG TPA: glycoside hydrolase family 57 protein, partial [Bryobacteraceae bacterium]|nr:glycoside hydrolase family 57 protein [Bryobacteraceae bacterium]